MKTIFLRWLVVLLMLPGIVQAQALPSAMQRSIAGLIEKKMVQRGFASNDPRWAATLQSGGSTIAGAAVAAAAITAAGVTAPAWVTAAATVALGGLLAYGINLAVDGVKWLMNGDGSVTYQVAGSPAGGGYSSTDYACFRDVGYGLSGACGSPSGLLAAWNAVAMPILYPPANWGVVTRTMTCGDVNATSFVCTVDFQNGVAMDGRKNGSGQTLPASAVCPTGYYVNGRCQAIPSSTQPTNVTKSPTEAANDLTPEQKAKPANPELVAKIADEAFKKAAEQPDYKGVPYDASNPITASDAQALQQSNPQSWPTVGDMVAPQTAASGQPASQPWSLPNTAAAPDSSTGTTPPVTTSGLDWAIPATSEKIDRQAIPVTYTPTFFASATGCPAPISYQMFGVNYLLPYQPFCDLMIYLAPVFLTLGAITAAFIFAESLKS